MTAKERKKEYNALYKGVESEIKLLNDLSEKWGAAKEKGKKNFDYEEKDVNISKVNSRTISQRREELFENLKQMSSLAFPTKKSKREKKAVDPNEVKRYKGISQVKEISDGMQQFLAKAKLGTVDINGKEVNLRDTLYTTNNPYTTQTTLNRILHHYNAVNGLKQDDGLLSADSLMKKYLGGMFKELTAKTKAEMKKAGHKEGDVKNEDKPENYKNEYHAWNPDKFPALSLIQIAINSIATAPEDVTSISDKEWEKYAETVKQLKEDGQSDDPDVYLDALKQIKKPSEALTIEANIHRDNAIFDIMKAEEDAKKAAVKEKAKKKREKEREKKKAAKEKEKAANKKTTGKGGKKAKGKDEDEESKSSKSTKSTKGKGAKGKAKESEEDEEDESDEGSDESSKSSKSSKSTKSGKRGGKAVESDSEDDADSDEESE